MKINILPNKESGKFVLTDNTNRVLSTSEIRENGWYMSVCKQYIIRLNRGWGYGDVVWFDIERNWFGCGFNDINIKFLPIPEPKDLNFVLG